MDLLDKGWTFLDTPPCAPLTQGAWKLSWAGEGGRVLSSDSRIEFRTWSQHQQKWESRWEEGKVIKVFPTLLYARLGSKLNLYSLPDLSLLGSFTAGNGLQIYPLSDSRVFRVSSEHVTLWDYNPHAPLGMLRVVQRWRRGRGPTTPAISDVLNVGETLCLVEEGDFIINLQRRRHKVTYLNIPSGQQIAVHWPSSVIMLQHESAIYRLKYTEDKLYVVIQEGGLAGTSDPEIEIGPRYEAKWLGGQGDWLLLKHGNSIVMIRVSTRSVEKVAQHYTGGSFIGEGRALFHSKHAVSLWKLDLEAVFLAGVTLVKEQIDPAITAFEIQQVQLSGKTCIALIGHDKGQSLHEFSLVENQEVFPSLLPSGVLESETAASRRGSGVFAEAFPDQGGFIEAGPVHVHSTAGGHWPVERGMHVQVWDREGRLSYQLSGNLLGVAAGRVWILSEGGEAQLYSLDGGTLLAKVAMDARSKNGRFVALPSGELISFAEHPKYRDEERTFFEGWQECLCRWDRNGRAIEAHAVPAPSDESLSPPEYLWQPCQNLRKLIPFEGGIFMLKESLITMAEGETHLGAFLQLDGQYRDFPCRFSTEHVTVVGPYLLEIQWSKQRHQLVSQKWKGAPSRPLVLDSTDKATHMEWVGNDGQWALLRCGKGLYVVKAEDPSHHFKVTTDSKVCLISGGLLALYKGKELELRQGEKRIFTCTCSDEIVGISDRGEELACLLKGDRVERVSLKPKAVAPKVKIALAVLILLYGCYRYRKWRRMEAKPIAPGEAPPLPTPVNIPKPKPSGPPRRVPANVRKRR